MDPRRDPRRADCTLPLLIRGARAVYWAWDARGSGTSDTVGPDQWKVWFQRLKLAENCLDEVSDRDPGTRLPILVAQAHLEHRWSEGGAKHLRRNDVAGETYAAAQDSLWHENYRRSLLTPVLWNHFAYALTMGNHFRAACEIYDQINDNWVRTKPWRSVDRYTELRALARDKPTTCHPKPTDDRISEVPPAEPVRFVALITNVLLPAASAWQTASTAGRRAPERVTRLRTRI